MHPPQNEISLVYKLLKNQILKRELTTSIFSLKLGVFGPSIVVPYGQHRKLICYLKNNDRICGKHTPLLSQLSIGLTTNARTCEGVGQV
jgi:hypothetical protein